MISFNILDVGVNLSDHLPLLAVCTCDRANLHSADEHQPFSDVRYFRWNHAPVDQYYECTRAILQPVLDQLNEVNGNLTVTLADDIYEKLSMHLDSALTLLYPNARNGIINFGGLFFFLILLFSS